MRLTGHDTRGQDHHFPGIVRHGMQCAHSAFSVSVRGNFALPGGSAKSHDRSFGVLRKSKTGNFSVVTLRVATLKFPDLVFFAIHPKFSIGTFGTAALPEMLTEKSRKIIFPA